MNSIKAIFIMGEGNHEIEKIIKEQENLYALHQQMYENLKILLENQKYNAENESLVIKNQGNIIRNQEVIVNNQVNIINNQKHIVENQISLAVMLKLQEMVINLLNTLAGSSMTAEELKFKIENLKNESRTEIHKEKLFDPKTI